MFDNYRLVLFSAYILLLACIAILTFTNNSKAIAFKRFYWIVASPLIVYSIIRPFPLMRDDPGYYDFFIRENLDFVLYQTKIITDPLYHFVLYLFKKIYNDSQILLLIAGIVLYVKLWIISHFPQKVIFLSLLTYTCLYYQLHDLTQLRASMAAMFFLVALHFLYYNKKKLTNIYLGLSFLSHASGIINFFMMFFSRYFTSKKILYITFVIVIIISWMNLYPSVNFFKELTSLYISTNGDALHKLRSYYYLAEVGVYNNKFNPPLIFLVLTACYSIVLLEIDIKKPINKFIIASFFIATVIGFFFNSLQDIQVRLYEFYFISGLFLIRQARSKASLIFVIFLSMMYFIKFNIRSQIGI